MTRSALAILMMMTACGSSGASGGGIDAAAARSDAPTTTTADAAAGSAADAAPSVAHDAGAAPDAAFVPTDPFTLDPTKTPMGFTQLATYFGAGATTAGGGTFTLVSRTRDSCNAVTGCTAWVEPSGVELMDSSGNPLSPPTTGTAGLALDTIYSPPSFSIAFAGSATFTCGKVPQTGAITWNCDGRSGGNSTVWLYGQYLGSPELDNTTLLTWKGLIATDGTYQFVTVLGSEQGTRITGENNLEQLAIYGTL